MSLKLKVLPVLGVLCLVGSSRADLNDQFPEPSDIKTGFADFEKIKLDDFRTQLSASMGGTSVYARVSYDGKLLGAFIPPNSSSNIDGEASAYSLARLLGIADSVQAGRLHSINGAELSTFAGFVLAMPVQTEARKENKNSLLTRIASLRKKGAPLDGVSKFWNHKPINFEALIANSSLNLSHPIAKWVQRSQKQPTNNEVIFQGAKTTEKTVANELSNQILIDALLAQWDRYSGGNVQYFTSNGTFHLALYDNGGTWGQPSWVQKNLRLVSRFNRNSVQVLKELDAFLDHKGSFHGAKDEQEVRAFLQLTYSDANWRDFKRNLKITLRYIDAIPESSAKYFE